MASKGGSWAKTRSGKLAFTPAFGGSTLDPRHLTPRQDRQGVQWLSKKPLAELRKRQSLIRRQLAIAFAKRDDVAVDRLTVMQGQHDRAIWQQQFGK